MCFEGSRSCRFDLMEFSPPNARELSSSVVNPNLCCLQVSPIHFVMHRFLLIDHFVIRFAAYTETVPVLDLVRHFLLLSQLLEEC